MKGRIAIGCDHAGFPLKGAILRFLKDLGRHVTDFGTFSEESVDYPDYVRPVCEALMRGECSEGILLCGSGVGAVMTANKFPGIRAALCHDTYSGHQCREHDDCNVLCMGPRVIGESLALEILRAWINAEFSAGERHVRRLEKVEAIEREFLKG
jgi:ribose 5-phosphate isomerase B